jgi:hypothetical protein
MLNSNQTYHHQHEQAAEQNKEQVIVHMPLAEATLLSQATNLQPHNCAIYYHSCPCGCAQAAYLSKAPVHTITLSGRIPRIPIAF